MDFDTIKLPLSLLFVILFTLCGPIKMLPTFYGISARMPAPERRALAFKASGFAFLGIVVAAMMGTGQITKLGVSREALGTAAGLLMALVGLRPLLGFDRKADPDPAPPDALALAFPIVLPPYAFGLIILFSLYAKSQADTVGIIAIGAVLMALNLLAMLAAAPIMQRIGITPLKVFGAVFGIVQLAFGIQIMFWGVSRGLLGST
jgi:multiple antibiotic resistance protein